MGRGVLGSDLGQNEDSSASAGKSCTKENTAFPFPTVIWSSAVLLQVLRVGLFLLFFFSFFHVKRYQGSSAPTDGSRNEESPTGEHTAEASGVCV